MTALSALQAANSARLERAETKRRVAAMSDADGLRWVASLLRRHINEDLTQVWLRTPVVEGVRQNTPGVLLWPKRVGRMRVNGFCLDANVGRLISQRGLTVGELTVREATHLIAVLEDAAMRSEVARG